MIDRFVKELIERLEEEYINCFKVGDYKYNKAIDKVKEIVNQLAEESNNGWIPCERELPEIGTCVLVTTESGYVCEEVLIYDYMHSKAKEPCFHRWDDEMWECYTPIVIAWMPLPPAFREKECVEKTKLE